MATTTTITTGSIMELTRQTSSSMPEDDQATIRTCPSVSHNADEEEEESAPPLPLNFLCWGLYPVGHDCLLHCSWMVAFLAQTIALLAAGLMVRGPREEEDEDDADKEDGENKEEDDDEVEDWGSIVSILIIVLSLSVAVLIVCFAFRVWRKHHWQQLQEQPFEEEKDKVADPSTVVEVDSIGGVEVQTPVNSDAAGQHLSWKYLCQHTAMEFAIFFMWGFVSLLRIIFSRSFQDRISPLASLSIYYTFVFGAFALCTYWYYPVQRYSQKLARLELLQPRSLGLIMLHSGCVVTVYVCFFSGIPVLIGDHYPWWWLILHVLAVVVGVTLLLAWVPRRAAY